MSDVEFESLQEAAAKAASPLIEEGTHVMAIWRSYRGEQEKGKERWSGAWMGEQRDGE
jgi:hypothetical protein